MKATFAAVALTLATALPGFAFDPAAMSDTEKKAFGEAVREYLMENPEVLVEAINQMEARRLANEAVNDKLLVQNLSAEIFEDGHSWVGGNPEGNLTMVEFVDYKCGFCKRVNPEVEALIKADGNIRFIIKEFPILGRESDLAAAFAVSVQQVAGPEAYKKVHDQMMASTKPVTLESLTQLAQDNGLDAQAVIGGMNSPEVSKVIRKNRQLAEKMAIQGTPTFIIGSELLRGIPQIGMAAAVAEIRKNEEG